MNTINSSTAKKVSVCIPVYNGSHYIAQAIESVLMQTYKDFQLIVCDNCSTDNTEEIVRNYHDPRLRYVRNSKNLGLVGNMNRCLELSDSEYVCIFHHDDIMLPDNLERKVHLLDEHPSIGFVHSNIILIDTKGEILTRNIWNEDSRKDYIENGQTVFQRYISYMHLGASIFIGAVLARRTCYEHLGGFNTELPHCSDSEMLMRMLLFYDVACIGTPLVKYRVHPLSASSHWGDYTSINYIKEHYLAVTKIFNKYKDHIPQSRSLKQQVSKSFAERYLTLACSALVNGDFVAGKTFFKEAITIYPLIFKNRNFWKATVGLAFGTKGIKLYQTAKKYLLQLTS